ncbi:MAG: hypothetical protein HWN68_10980 [Desulfobacterales bacterium]|nr:hypothetical protein [Desulfobacterales bacterium]
MPRPIWHYQRGISRTARDIMRLRTAGISEVSPPLARLLRVQSELITSLGVKIPRPMTLLLRLIGLSPGEISLWHDAEGGWFTEARARPGARPIYHYVDDATAIAIIKGELTHEAFEALSLPDPYVGD